MTIRTVTATRYVTPLREGGSLPAIVEADDDGLYVVKFRGAGQGTKALIAELVVGTLARAAGLPMPEIVFVSLDAELGRSEPDAEIQDLIRASTGTNLGVDYLPGSVTFDPLAETVAPALASSIVWFDAFATNVDRTPRNANLLMWHRSLWLIDHGAALYFQHAWPDALAGARRPFSRVRDHVLLPFADRIADVDAAMAAALSPPVVAEAVAAIPDDWLVDDPLFAGPDAHERQRAAYATWLTTRLAAPRDFAAAAAAAYAEAHAHV